MQESAWWVMLTVPSRQQPVQHKKNLHSFHHDDLLSRRCLILTRLLTKHQWHSPARGSTMPGTRWQCCRQCMRLRIFHLGPWSPFNALWEGIPISRKTRHCSFQTALRAVTHMFCKIIHNQSSEQKATPGCLSHPSATHRLKLWTTVIIFPCLTVAFLKAEREGFCMSKRKSMHVWKNTWLTELCTHLPLAEKGYHEVLSS